MHITATDEQSAARDDDTSPMVRYPQLKNEGVPFSRQHLSTWLEERGEYPRRIQLSANVIAWDRAEIRAWRARRRDRRAP